MKCLIMNYLTINNGSAGPSRPGSAVVVPVVEVVVDPAVVVVVAGGKQVTVSYKFKELLIIDN